MEGGGIRLPAPASVVPVEVAAPPARGPVLAATAPLLSEATSAQRVEAADAILRDVRDALCGVGREARLAPALADALAGVRLGPVARGDADRLDVAAILAELRRHPAPAHASLVGELLETVVGRALEVAGDHLPAAGFDALLGRVAGWTRRVGV